MTRVGMKTASTRTHIQVTDAPEGKDRVETAASAASGISEGIQMVQGRWKLQVLFELFSGEPRRFSELQRAVEGISAKVLTEQLRQLEHDGVVLREVFPEVPPRVEYRLSPWGMALCPALDALLSWRRQQPE